MNKLFGRKWFRINLFPTENSLLVGITILMDNNFHVRPTYRIIDFVITDFFQYIIWS